MSILNKHLVLSIKAACPYCGHVITISQNGITRCSGCHKIIHYENGEVKGWS